MRTRFPTAITAAVVLGMLGFLPATPAAAADPIGVSGTVTAAGGGPIGGVQVLFFGTTGYGGTITATDGTYSIDTLTPDSYRILFDTSLLTTGSHVPEYWNDKPLDSLADTVTLVGGDNQEFNAVLAVGGQVTGTVRGNEGGGTISVRAYLEKPGSPGVFEQFQNTTPLADGSYALRGLLPGNYKVTFGDNSSVTRYGLEEWDNEHFGSGDIVTVVGTTTTSNINADLTPAGPVTVSRLAGIDRFSTSAAVWDDYPTGLGGTIYIASGRNFPDALGAGPAAAQTDSPLMLVDTDAISPAVLAQLSRLDPDRIVIVGGFGTISQGVEDQLETLAPDVERIAGTDRYDTSRQLVEFAFDVGEFSEAVFLATGANFPDALSAGPAASQFTNAPVILVPGGDSALDAGTLALINDLDPIAGYVVGSTGSVSAGIATSLGTTGISVTRVSGIDRYATSLALNTQFFGGYPRAYLATGVGFADALSGAARAANDHAPLFTVPGTCVPLDDMIDMSQNNTDEVVLLGGPGTLSDRVEALYRC